MAAMKQRVNNLKGSEYFAYPLYIAIDLDAFIHNYLFLIALY